MQYMWSDDDFSSVESRAARFCAYERGPQALL